MFRSRNKLLNYKRIYQNFIVRDYVITSITLKTYVVAQS